MQVLLQFLLVLGFLFPTVAGHGYPELRANGNEVSLRVLFIGNSYTYFNNLPAQFAEFVRSAGPGRPVETEMLTVGGGTLSAYWNNGSAQAAIRRGGWTHVVLQEQSSLNSGRVRDGKPVIGDAEVFAGLVALYDAEIRAVGAKTVLFMTWSHRSLPEQQSLLIDAYRRAGERCGGLVIPAGIAFQEARTVCPGIELYAEDGSHPSPAGSYLAALTLAQVIGGTLPDPLPSIIHGQPIGDDGTPIAGASKTVLVRLPKETADCLQRAVETTLSR